MSPLGIRLRDVRESKGLSQAELAELAGTHQGTISLLESGRTRQLNLDLLERIAHALGLPAASLFVETPAAKRRRPVAAPQPRTRKIPPPG